jgi:hypothetical protein
MQEWTPKGATMTIDLQRGRFLRVMDGVGSTLTARGGEVWVTEQDSPRDVVLRPGQSFRLGRPGLALVEAFTDASVSINP